jgi:hypothetical protein
MLRRLAAVDPFKGRHFDREIIVLREVVPEFQAEFQGFGPDHVGARHGLGTSDDSALGTALCS